MMVASTGIAMSLWVEVLPLAPVIGSLLELIPTAFVPHYLFHTLLVRVKERKISQIERQITGIVEDEADASLRDLIRLEGLLRVEAHIRRETAWLVDIKIFFALLAATFMKICLIEVLSILLSI
jgi:hypothetical protein